MTKEFYTRLRNYYKDVAKVLLGTASASSIFPNTTDIGVAREQLYAKFLQLHVPTSCNVFLGGFLFGLDGSESKQIDIIVTSDSSPQFNLLKEGTGKAFACIEGAVAVVSVKSYLSSEELLDALGNLASLPDKEPLSKERLAVVFNNFYYKNWPFKIIYASDGISEETLKIKLNEYYKNNPLIPPEKRPDLIHVAGKYYVMKIIPGLEIEFKDGISPLKDPMVSTDDPDVCALAYAVDSIHDIAFQSKFIIFRYNKILTNLWSQTIRIK